MNTEEYFLNKNSITQLLRILPDCVFWKDKKGMFLGCNKNFAHSFGFSSENDLIGKGDYDLPIYKEDSCAYQTDDHMVIQTGHAKLYFEEKATFIDGRQRILLTSKFPLVNDANKIIGVLGFFSDITESKQNTHIGSNQKHFPICTKNSSSKKVSLTQTLELTQSIKLFRKWMLHSPPNDSCNNLSHRQQECAFFLIRGYTYNQIAQKLNIKLSTVQTHVEHIKAKLNVSTHAQMIEKMIDLGFIHHLPDFIK